MHHAHLSKKVRIFHKSSIFQMSNIRNDTERLFILKIQKREMWKNRLQPCSIAQFVILQHLSSCSKTLQPVLANDPQFCTDYSSVAMLARDTADDNFFPVISNGFL